MVLKPRRPVRARGISAQGIVNGVNDTWVPPPHVPGFKGIAPCRAERRDRGNAPDPHGRIIGGWYALVER